jgi:putative ABC transport system permease protein
VLPRQILVAGQFVVSILLISATIIVYQQIQHIKKRDMGYNPDNLIMIPGSADTQKNFEVIKQELLQTGMVEAIQEHHIPLQMYGLNHRLRSGKVNPRTSKFFLQI